MTEQSNEKSETPSCSHCGAATVPGYICISCEVAATDELENLRAAAEAWIRDNLDTEKERELFDRDEVVLAVRAGALRERRRLMGSSAGAYCIHHKDFRRVIVESPYGGNVEANLEYLARCMNDCIHRGEAPFASHGLYTRQGVLDDDVPSERHKGMMAGFAWRHVAAATVVYTDRGISPGMRKGIDHAESIGIPIEYRKLK